jgi:tetratricopeptide (TPR) repeat protein
MLPPNAYLPYLRNDDFHGRQDILKQLASALLPWSQAETDLPHPVVISGLGGMGKTQLAVEFAYRYGRFFAGGLFWINFGEAQNVASEVANLGGERAMRLFRAEEKLTLAERVARVQQAWQEHTPRLLIFDDCGDEDLLAQWLPVSGGCRVLITSRRGSWSRALRLTGVSLPALAVPESVALLRRMVPDLDRDAAAEIAGEVGHLPLALHLAGGFLRRYPLVTPARYLAQLRHEGLLAHPSLRGRGSERSPTGHALDVARTFALSLERLDAGDAVDALSLKLLAHAAAFAPGIPLSRDLLLGTMVAEDADLGRLLTAEEGLVRLLTLGLLTTVDRRRVVLHELLAAFSREDDGEDNEAQQAVERTVYELLHKQNQQRNSLFELPLAPAHLRFLVENALQRADVAAADLAFLYGVHLNLVADFAASQLTMQQGAAIYERQYGPDHPETARYLIGLGALYNRSGRYWKARAIYERVLTIRESAGGAGDGPTANALNNLGYQLILQGDFGAARPYLQRALAIELADPDHPRVASVWKNLGTVALACEDYEEATSCLQKSLDIRRRALGARHPHTASTLEQMARLHLQRKAYDRAQDYFDRALAIFEETLGENHPHTARALNGLGILALARDDLQKANAYLQRALDAQQAVFADDHPELGITYRNLGDLALARGDEAQAAGLFRRAVAILQKSVDPNHPDLRQAREQVQRLSRNDDRRIGNG